MLLSAVFGAIATWQYAEQARFNQLVLDTQQIGWTRFEATALERLRAASMTIAGNPGLVPALARDDVDTVRALSNRDMGAIEVDVFDESGKIIYTSSAALEQELQLDVAGIQRVIGAGREVAGLMPTGADAFSLIVAVPVRRDGEVIGGVTLGLPVEPALTELSQGLGRLVALVNLRGHAVTGNGAALYNSMDPDLALRRSGATEAAYRGHQYRIATIPALGHDGRQVAAFVTLQDVSLEGERERDWLLGSAGVALVLVAAILVGLFTHLRQVVRAPRPGGRGSDRALARRYRGAPGCAAAR